MNRPSEQFIIRRDIDSGLVDCPDCSGFGCDIDGNDCLFCGGAGCERRVATVMDWVWAALGTTLVVVLVVGFLVVTP